MELTKYAKDTKDMISSALADTQKLLMLKPQLMDLRSKELEMEAKAKDEERMKNAKARDEERAKELEFILAKAKAEHEAKTMFAVPMALPVAQGPVPSAPKTLWTIREIAIKEEIIKPLQRKVQNNILGIVGHRLKHKASPTEKVVEGSMLVNQFHTELYDEIKTELEKERDRILIPSGQTKITFARMDYLGRNRNV